MTQTPTEPPVNPPFAEAIEAAEVIQRPLPEDFDSETLYQQLTELGLLLDPNAPPQPWVEFRLGEGETVEFRLTDPAAEEQIDAILAEHPALAQANAMRRQAENDNRRTIEEQAALALDWNKEDIATNNTYMALASPTNAQVAAQVRELTRQSTRQARELTGLIRLVLNRLEAAD